MTATKKSGKKKPIAGTSQKQKQEEETLKKELKEKNDKLMRAYADIQNLQKRMEKQREQEQYDIKIKYLLEILDIYELLQKASQDNNPQQGLLLIIQTIEQLLEKEHISCVDCLGQPFDHSSHHAICTVEQPDAEEGEIIEEVKKGYKINNRLLRPSQVIVATKKKKE